MSDPTRKGQADRFLQNLKRVEQLTDQTAVHRKKFEFALSQLRKFCQAFSERSDDTPLSESERAASTDFVWQLNALRELISQHLLQTWSLPTIENPSSFVLEQLKQIFQQIKTAAEILDPSASTEIDPDLQQWIQYHVLDLRAIHASFTQYVKLKGLDEQLSNRIQTRLRSIDSALPHGDEQGPVRVFSPIPVHYQSWRVNYSDFEERKLIGQGISNFKS
jgi:hypothetical protein